MYYELLISVQLDAQTVNIAPHTGTGFVETENSHFYTDVMDATINIQLPSPRLQLNFLSYKNCFVCLDETPIDQCEPQFAAWDDDIIKFLSLDLVYKPNFRNIHTETEKVSQLEDEISNQRKFACTYYKLQNQGFKELGNWTDALRPFDEKVKTKWNDKDIPASRRKVHC